MLVFVSVEQYSPLIYSNHLLLNDCPILKPRIAIVKASDTKRLARANEIRSSQHRRKITWLEHYIYLRIITLVL